MIRTTAKERAQARSFLYKRGHRPSSDDIEEFIRTAKSEGLTFGQLYDQTRALALASNAEAFREGSKGEVDEGGQA